MFTELQEPEISHGEVVCSYVGLLTQGQSAFEAIEPFRHDRFFAMALGCERVPSAPTLRQRLNAAPPAEWQKIVREETLALLRSMKVKLTSTHGGRVPLDAEVSPFDNSDSKKEGLGKTDKKVMGYAPIFFYLGQEGYLLDLELRTGSTPSQNNFAPLLGRAIASARQLTSATLLLRLDAAHDSVDNLIVCQQATKANPSAPVDYIIKHNLRQETLNSWLELAQQHGSCAQPRPGKKVWTGSLMKPREGMEQPVRLVFEVIERTIDAKGQTLMLPELEVATYWTSLPDDPQTIFALYREHGAMEQFHSEVKTDLDLERL